MATSHSDGYGLVYRQGISQEVLAGRPSGVPAVPAHQEELPVQEDSEVDGSPECENRRYKRSFEKRRVNSSLTTNDAYMRLF